MDKFDREALAMHNRYRQDHKVPNLTWSPKLAKEAQAWANKLAKTNTLQHASQKERNQAGENIAMFSDRDETAAEEATNMWYSEVAKFNFANPTFQSGTGHFTQVVWKDSKELGMARAKTADGKGTYVVARYSPAGNKLGDFDKNVFPSHSKNAKTSSPREDRSSPGTRVVERSTTGPGGTVRTVVKETRIQTPQGVKTIKTTTTMSSNTTQPPKRFDETKWEEPQSRFKSLHISSDDDKAKTTPSGTKPSTGGKPSPAPSMTGSFKEQALKLHNHYRRLHQSPDVTWSNELERDAQTWANKLARSNTLQHATSKERNGDGENLAFFGGKRENYAKEAVDMWYGEEKKYQYKSASFKSGTGHFTQVVWKGTKQIAVACAQSSDGRNTYIVGRYRPAGNMLGDFEANVFPPKR